MWLTLSPESMEVRTNRIVGSTGQPWLTGLPTKPKGSIWLGSAQGLHRFDSTGLHMIESDPVGQRLVDFIHEDRASNLWVNLKPGALYRGDSSGWCAVDMEHRSESMSTVCMEEDQEGNLWLGTEQGLVQLQAHRIRTYTTRDGLPDDNVWSVCESSDVLPLSSVPLVSMLRKSVKILSKKVENGRESELWSNENAKTELLKSSFNPHHQP